MVRRRTIGYSLNVHRRHLEYDQRVALAVIRKQEIQASGIIRAGNPTGANQYDARNCSDFGTIPQTEKPGLAKSIVSEIGHNSQTAAVTAATELKVGRNAVYEAEKVQQEAPELFEVMLDGGIKLRPAVRECEERKRRALAVFPHIVAPANNVPWWIYSEIASREEKAAFPLGGLPLRVSV